MKWNPFAALALSPVAPGLGHVYAGKPHKGAAILAASATIGSLNVVFLSSFAAADPEPTSVWAYWTPRIGHDIVAVWSIAPSGSGLASMPIERRRTR